MQAAVNTSVQILQSGIPIAKIEFLEELYLEAVNQYSKLDYPVKPTLFLEFTGSPQSVQEQVATASQLLIFECTYFV